MPHDLFGSSENENVQAPLSPEPPADQMEALEKRLASAYAQIGEKAFPDLCSLPEYSELAAEVNEAKSRIEMLKAEAERLEKERAQKLAQFTCPSCQMVNVEGSKFCEGCGAKLGGKPAAGCPSCGALNPSGAKFCPECGAKLEEKRESACPACGVQNPPGTKFCAECGVKQGV